MTDNPNVPKSTSATTRPEVVGLRPQHGQVRFDHDRTDHFAVEDDGTSQQRGPRR